MNNIQSVQQAAHNLFLGCAPERKPDLEKLWEKYQPEFKLLDDTGPNNFFKLEAGLFRVVQFNHRAMRAFWLAGFIAWEGYHAVAKGSNESGVDLSRFSSMVQVFRDMLASEDPEKIPLPEGVPDPGCYTDPSIDSELCAVAELATVATGWALLHEIKHIQHQQDGTSTTHSTSKVDLHAEEFSCDQFATSFIIDKLTGYAAISGYDECKIRQKRELGVYFSLFAMVLIAVDAWDESETHPAMQDRIEKVIGLMGANGTSLSDAIAHSSFVALWKLYPHAPGPFKISN